MKSTNLLRIFFIAGVISLFISYLGIWIRFMKDPVERTGSDFIAFYSAGRVAQSRGAADVYNLQFQQKIQEEQVGFPLVTGQVLAYNHLPFLIPILRAIVSPDYVKSFSSWVFLLVGLYLIGILFLSQALKDSGMDSLSTLRAGIGSFLFLPLWFSLMNGQDSAFLFLGASIWVYGLYTGKENIAGLGLSLTTVRPHIALVLALPMFFSHRKVFWTFMIGSAILAFFSLFILGMEGTQEFIDILILSAGGEWYGMKENAMYNLIGLLARGADWLGADVTRLLGWAVYGTSIIGLCILWAKTKDLQDGKIGLTVGLALFAVPHLHFHDLALMLILIYELMRLSTRTGEINTQLIIISPIAISLLLLISNISRYLQYSIPYLLLLALAGYPYFLKYWRPIPTQNRS